MFDNGILIFLKYFVLNTIGIWAIGMPFFLGLFGDLLKGVKLRIVSRFFGILVISTFIFNLNFLFQGIGRLQYLICFIVGIIIFVARIYYSKIDIKNLISIEKLDIKFEFENNTEKYLTIIGTSLVGLFLIITFTHTINFPNYGDDSYGNRNGPSTNIFYDNGIKFFGNTGEILGRGRLGYPIHMPLFNAQINKMEGSRNTIYTDLRQRFGLFGILLLSFIVGYEKSRKAFFGIIGPVIICGLPLVFFHAIDGYMELPSIYFMLVSSFLVVEYITKGNDKSLIVGLIFTFFLPNIKNDGLVLYSASLVLGMLTILLYNKNIFTTLKNNIIKLLFGLVIVFAPMFLIRLYHGGGINPIQDSKEQIGSVIHYEIFDVIPGLFYSFGNYNLILLLAVLLLIILFGKKIHNLTSTNKNTLFFILISSGALLVIVNMVFLLTENYQWVMNQTTVNRIYTNAFVFLGFYLGYIISIIEGDNKEDK